MAKTGKRNKHTGLFSRTLRILGFKNPPRRVKRRSQAQRFQSEFRHKGGGVRNTTLRVLGGKLDPYGLPFFKEHFEFEDQLDGPRVVDLVQTSTCSFGHTIDEKIRVAGICEIGNEVLCSTEGCLQRCIHCGAAVCRIHSSTYGDKTYCRNHLWIHYWRMFWRLD